MVIVLLPAVSSAQWVWFGQAIFGELPGDNLGYSVALSSHGTRLAIGAPRHDGVGIESGRVQVYEYSGPTSGWVQLGPDIQGEAPGDMAGLSVALSTDGSVVAVGAPYNAGNGVDSGQVRVFDWDGSSWNHRGPEIWGEAAGDKAGHAVAISSNGSRVAVGAPNNNDAGDHSGHVRVYDWAGTSGIWVRVGQDIDGEAAGDTSGHLVALSADGSRVAIGADQNDGNGDHSGHVRVFEYSPFPVDRWLQIGSDIDGEAAGDWAGSVALSAAGDRLAVGAPLNDGLNGDDSGHVRVYRLFESDWVQLGSDIDGEAAEDKFGNAVALSSDGRRLAIGAPYNDGSFTNAGHVRVYEFYPWVPDEWLQVGEDINGYGSNDFTGHSVALSSNGSLVAVGAPTHNGSGTDPDAGLVFVFSDVLFADGFESGNTSGWSNTVL